MGEGAHTQNRGHRRQRLGSKATVGQKVVEEEAADAGSAVEGNPVGHLGENVRHFGRHAHAGSGSLGPAEAVSVAVERKARQRV